MGWFLNLRTGHKLAIAFGLCLTLSTIVGVTAVVRMGQMNRTADLLNSDTVMGLKYVGRITRDCKEYRNLQFEAVLESDPTDVRRTEAEAKDTSVAVDNDIAAYMGTVTLDADRANINDFKDKWSQYRAYDDKLLAMDQSNDDKGALRLMIGPMKSAYATAMIAGDTVAEWNAKRGVKLSSDAAGTYVSARATVIVLMCAAILIGIFMATIVTKIIIRNLESFAKVLDALAAGDMTVRLYGAVRQNAVNSSDEFATLGSSLDSAQTSLAQLIAQTRNASIDIGAAANEVSTGNQDMSQRTTEQASSLEETASSMEELTSTVKQNADNSRQANQLAAHARELAEKGGAVVDQAVAAMGEINQGSKKIAEIISVIDEIAFQTNLLALNASVEAARVGEQGRGFAVVAAEVRNLAGRSATAAKEIKSLVGDTVQKVQSGSDLVNQSGAQLQEIVGSVKKVADIIAEISAASIEQSQGIEQVNTAVMQMDQMTQQSAAMVEEGAATSESMARLAQELQVLVGKFKLDESYTMQSTPDVKHQTDRVSATGTYGARGGHKRVAPAKLKLVSNGAGAAAAKDDDFEEF